MGITSRVIPEYPFPDERSMPTFSASFPFHSHRASTMSETLSTSLPFIAVITSELLMPAVIAGESISEEVTYTPDKPDIKFAHFAGNPGESFTDVISRLRKNGVYKFDKDDDIMLRDKSGRTIAHFVYDGKQWNGNYIDL